MLNSLAHNGGKREDMLIKFMPLRYFLIFIFCVIFPIIIYICTAICACLIGPIALLGVLFLFIPKSSKGCDCLWVFEKTLLLPKISSYED